MPNEIIQNGLQERFAAPLPEFYRRIVFWQDPDREFEKDASKPELPGVCIIRLTGTNNFSVKKLLLHNDSKTEDSVILSIEQCTADATTNPCKADKVIAKK